MEIDCIFNPIKANYFSLELMYVENGTRKLQWLDGNKTME